MSTNLAIQLSEQAFAALSEQAIAAGKTPSELAESVVECIYAGGRSKPIDPATARAEFERCFGSVDLGRPIGLANEAIDADLAREYGAPTGSA
jgi:hypothetical protein